MNRNKNLYWYGFFAKLKQIAGVYLIAFSFFISLMLSLYSGYLFNLFWVGLVLGLILIFKGKSQRFDYKMQSGYMVHSGDGC